MSDKVGPVAFEEDGKQSGEMQKLVEAEELALLRVRERESVCVCACVCVCL